MRKITIILLLVMPVLATAQENLMGKSRSEIKAHFQKEKISLYETDNSGPNAYDEYRKAEAHDITCFFDKTGICGKELDTEPYATLAKLKPVLDRDWVKIDDNVWANKEKTIKVRLNPVQALNQLYIIYTKFDKEPNQPF